MNWLIIASGSYCRNDREGGIDEHGVREIRKYRH